MLQGGAKIYWVKGVWFSVSVLDLVWKESGAGVIERLSKSRRLSPKYHVERRVCVWPIFRLSEMVFKFIELRIMLVETTHLTQDE